MPSTFAIRRVHLLAAALEARSCSTCCAPVSRCERPEATCELPVRRNYMSWMRMRFRGGRMVRSESCGGGEAAAAGPAVGASELLLWRRIAARTSCCTELASVSGFSLGSCGWICALGGEVGLSRGSGFGVTFEATMARSFNTVPAISSASLHPRP